MEAIPLIPPAGVIERYQGILESVDTQAEACEPGVPEAMFERCADVTFDRVYAFSHDLVTTMHVSPKFTRALACGTLTAEMKRYVDTILHDCADAVGRLDDCTDLSDQIINEEVKRQVEQGCLCDE